MPGTRPGDRLKFGGSLSKGWRHSRIDEIPVLGSDLVDSQWRPVRHHFGISAFGANAYVAREAGETVVETHVESDGDPPFPEELYVVIAGRARFTLDGESLEAAPGSLVFVEPPVTRGAVALEPGTTVLAIGAAPGSFDVSSWEAERTG